MKTPSEMSGVKLREAVATEVMGVHVIHYNKHDDPGRPCTTVVIPDGVNQIDFCGTLTLHKLRKAIPAYESTWEGAGQVVEKMRERGFVFFYLSTVPCDEATRSKASFAKATPLGRKSPVMHDAIAETVPLAICRASLQAVRAAK